MVSKSVPPWRNALFLCPVQGKNTGYTQLIRMLRRT